MNHSKKKREGVFGIITFVISSRQDVDPVCPCLLLATRLDPYWVFLVYLFYLSRWAVSNPIYVFVVFGTAGSTCSLLRWATVGLLPVSAARGANKHTDTIFASSVNIFQLREDRFQFSLCNKLTLRFAVLPYKSQRIHRNRVVVIHLHELFLIHQISFLLTFHSFLPLAFIPVTIFHFT
jgi:hypothetical protein